MRRLVGVLQVTQDVIFPLGCDFQYEVAATWYTNTDKLIHWCVCGAVHTPEAPQAHCHCLGPSLPNPLTRTVTVWAPPCLTH